MSSTASIRSRLVAVAAATSLILAACGGDSDDGATTTESTDDTAAETTDTSAEAEETTSTTAEAVVTTTTAAADDAADGDGNGDAAVDGVATELGEWFVTMPDEALTAGTITFAIENTGENPHALAVAKGTSYEDLPQLDNGAVDTDALGDDFLGRIDNIASGDTGTGEWELEAGDYVFFCPIQFGPNSHAGAGQVLSVTVG